MIEALTPAYLERLANPRGLGDLEPADLAGESGSIVGGAGVRVMLRLARDAAGTRRIVEASFRSLGSAAARAPGSVLVERLVGADLASARAITRDDLCRPLGPAIPAAVSSAAERLCEALARALEDGAATARVGAPGLLVCRCMGVGDREVRRAVRRGARDVPMIGVDCAAGTGCHSCWPDLRALLAETSEAKVPNRPTRDTPGPSGLVESAIEAVIRPIWHAQGLELGGVEREGLVVRLSLAGVADGALASPLGGVALARHVLRETLDDAVRVELGEAVPGAAQRGGPNAR